MTTGRKLCYCVDLPDFLSSAPLHLQSVASDQSAAVAEISCYNMKLQPCEASAACADTDPDAPELEHPSWTLCLLPSAHLHLSWDRRPSQATSWWDITGTAAEALGAK